MAVLISKGRGRPHYVADIDFTEDPALFYYDRFYEACHSFCYRDVMALSRALRCSPRTVYAWKYGEKCPRIGIMLAVMDWTRAGKPMKTEQPGKVIFSML